MKRHVLSTLFLGAVAVGAILAAQRFAEPADSKPQAVREEVTALLKVRRDTLKQIVDEAEGDLRDGMVSAPVVSRATVDWLNAEFDLAGDHATRVAIRERIAAHLRKTEAALETALKKTAPAPGKARAHTESYEFLAVKAARCQAEIDLLRERAKNN